MGGAVNSSDIPKQLVNGHIIHRLTSQKDVIQMLHQMNSTTSCSNIIQQNKIWVNRIWQ